MAGLGGGLWRFPLVDSGAGAAGKLLPSSPISGQGVACRSDLTYCVCRDKIVKQTKKSDIRVPAPRTLSLQTGLYVTTQRGTKVALRQMRLQHLHLPHRAPSLYPPYSLASRIQEHLRRRQLDFKDATSTSTSPSSAAAFARDGEPAAGPPTLPPPGVTATQRQQQQQRQSPPPTLLSFTPMPTYTLGRRQTAPLTAHEAARLKAPLRVGGVVLPTATTPSPVPPSPSARLPVSVVHSPRGGQTTYHGPGQTVLWPVLDLKSPHHKQFTVRCYSWLLEDTTIAVLRSLFGLSALATEDPGVWVSPASASSNSRLKDLAKIAALGVHLRRHVTALGTAVNIAMPSADVFSEDMNPWARIVACGLEGKIVTSVAAEMVGGLLSLDERLGSSCPREEGFAISWASELAKRIGVDGVDAATQEDVLSLVTDILSRSNDATPEEAEYVTRLQALL
ncbi:hypothetical protein B0T16DRAFT_500636 [Cercophora newfieldiana]|uniref:lipoyl(octanoyl) transferase n=1 Tax=Cercophora newfieldiana TaxID=92897 RepID=A0AA39YPE6_9PEZI|nr:hypothetical protein B0T16DRAFT_500636 [Cercophora newfieldiana]